jgi:hypothetical protein
MPEPTRGFVMDISYIGFALLALVAIAVLIMVVAVGFGDAVV